MTERDNVLAVATALRAVAQGNGERVDIEQGAKHMAHPVLVEQARLLALASTIERSLAANIFDQPPSLKEWRAMVLRHSEAAAEAVPSP